MLIIAVIIILLCKIRSTVSFDC